MATFRLLPLPRAVDMSGGGEVHKLRDFGTGGAESVVVPGIAGEDVVHERMSDTCVKSRFGGPPLTTCPSHPSKQPHDTRGPLDNHSRAIDLGSRALTHNNTIPGDARAAC